MYVGFVIDSNNPQQVRSVNTCVNLYNMRVFGDKKIKGSKRDSLNHLRYIFMKEINPQGFNNNYITLGLFFYSQTCLWLKTT